MYIQTDNFGTDDTYRCRYHKNKYSYPSHVHQFSEVAIVLKGEIDIICAKSSTRAKAGDIVFIPPFLPHGFKTEDSCDIWIAVFSPSMLSELATEISARDIGIFTASVQLFEYASDRLIFSSEITKHGIRAALFAIGEEFLRRAPEREGMGEGGMLSRLLLYLEEHYREELTLGSVASALGYSTSYISHALGHLPDMSFPHLLSGIRIEHSKGLLLSTSLSVSEIAHECGFSCERSFHRSFSRLVGKTPLAYRSSALISRA